MKENKVMINIRIDKEVRQKLKVKLAREDKTITKLLIEYINQYIKQ